MDRDTQQAYDTVAADYAQLLPDLSVEAPLDRAVLAAFVEMVGDGPVVEVGSGTGRVTAHLADAGLCVVGLDLSPGMTTVARQIRPDIAVAVADVVALPVRSDSLAGLVAWYAVIHLAPEALPGALEDCARVLRPGAPLLVAFQTGDERLDRTSAYGHPVRLTSYRHPVQAMAGALAEAGFVPYATVIRDAVLSHETTPQAFVLATGPGGGRHHHRDTPVTGDRWRPDGLPGSAPGRHCRADR